MPDLIRTRGELVELRRKMVVRVGDNEDAERFGHPPGTSTSYTAVPWARPKITAQQPKGGAVGEESKDESEHTSRSHLVRLARCPPL
jgi:hypothetical protein